MKKKTTKIIEITEEDSSESPSSVNQTTLILLLLIGFGLIFLIKKHNQHQPSIIINQSGNDGTITNHFEELMKIKNGD